MQTSMPRDPAERIQELLLANNRNVEARRAASARVRELEALLTEKDARLAEAQRAVALLRKHAGIA